VYQGVQSPFSHNDHLMLSVSGVGQTIGISVGVIIGVLIIIAVIIIILLLYKKRFDYFISKLFLLLSHFVFCSTMELMICCQTPSVPTFLFGYKTSQLTEYAKHKNTDYPLNNDFRSMIQVKSSVSGSFL